MPSLNLVRLFAYLASIILIVGCSKPSLFTKTVVVGGSATAIAGFLGSPVKK